MINGRSMPDDMDNQLRGQYPHQPTTVTPHMHPGDLTLLRSSVRALAAPFHEHGNHVRILARDGNPILAPDGTSLAGPLLFTTTTTPGLAMDGIFYWSGKGLNWDAYGHHAGSSDPLATLTCHSGCQRLQHRKCVGGQLLRVVQDHNKPMEAKPFGDIGEAARSPCRSRTCSPMVPGTEAAPIWDPMPRYARSGPTGSTPPSGTIGTRRRRNGLRLHVALA